MNDQQRAAIQMAWEYIDWMLSGNLSEPAHEALDVEAALRESLAQPQGEPVASNVLSDDLRNLAERFSEGWHEGMEIDASDIMLLLDAAIAIEDVAPPVVPQGEPVVCNCHELERLAEDAECVAMCLDDAGVPKDYGKGNGYSLWGRVCRYAESTTPPSVEAMRIETLEKSAKLLLDDSYAMTFQSLGHPDGTYSVAEPQPSVNQPTAHKSLSLDDVLSAVAPNEIAESLAQPQGSWVDLTDEEFETAIRKLRIDETMTLRDWNVGRAVIAKFKEKNTPPSVEAAKEKQNV